MSIIAGLDYIMVTINSSVNFIIYYLIGGLFRKEVKKIAEELRQQFQKLFLIFFWYMFASISNLIPYQELGDVKLNVSYHINAPTVKSIDKNL